MPTTSAPTPPACRAHTTPPAAASAPQAVTTYLSDKWHLQPVAVSRGLSAHGRIINHCGFLLAAFRSGTVKMRWVTVEAGHLWFFRDENTAEPLERLRLHGCSVQRNLRTRELTVVHRRRSVRLIAADLNESLVWARVLTQAVALEERASFLHDAATALAGSALFSSIDALVDSFVPHAATAGASTALPGSPRAGATEQDGVVEEAASDLPSDARRERLYAELSFQQEEALCAFLLCIHTFGDLDEILCLLQSRYDVEYDARRDGIPRPVWVRVVQQPCRRRIALVLLRWAQIHPYDLQSPSNKGLRLLWQQAARDGYFAEFGLRSGADVDGARSDETSDETQQPLDAFNDVARYSMRERVEARQRGPDTPPVFLPFVDVQRWTVRSYLSAALHRAARKHSIAAIARQQSLLLQAASQTPGSVRAPPAATVGFYGDEDGHTSDEEVAGPAASPAQSASPPAPPPPLLESSSSVAAAFERVGIARVWLSMDPTETARHMTLVDEALYHKVGALHLLSYVWGKKAGGRGAVDKLPLIELTQSFNLTASLISSAVVSSRDLLERAQLMSQFVAVGMELLKLGNFNGLTAILAGLSNSAVYRLRGCQQSMPSESRADWESMQQLMSPSGAYAEYRAALAQQQHSPPFIPYVGVHLTDLTFIGEGNKDWVEQQINFGKRQKVNVSEAEPLGVRSSSPHTHLRTHPHTYAHMATAYAACRARLCLGAIARHGRRLVAAFGICRPCQRHGGGKASQLHRPNTRLGRVRRLRPHLRGRLKLRS